MKILSTALSAMLLLLLDCGPLAAQEAEPEQAVETEEAVVSGPYDPKEEEVTEEQAPAPAPEPAKHVVAEKKPATEPPKEEGQVTRKARPVEDANLFAVTGARPIPMGQRVLRLDVGYPQIMAVYHVPISNVLELAPGGGIFYGWNGATAGEVFGIAAKVEVKWLFYDNENHTLAFVAEPGLTIPLEPQSALGLMAGGPGIRYNYCLEKKYNLNAGVAIPIGLLFADGGSSLRFPMVVKVGAEFNINPDLNLYFNMAGGLDSWTNGYPASNNPDNAEPYVNMVVGAAYRM